MKTLTHEPEHEHGLGTRSPFCLFSGGQKKETNRGQSERGDAEFRRDAPSPLRPKSTGSAG